MERQEALRVTFPEYRHYSPSRRMGKLDNGALFKENLLVRIRILYSIVS